MARFYMVWFASAYESSWTYLLHFQLNEIEAHRHHIAIAAAVAAAGVQAPAVAAAANIPQNNQELNAVLPAVIGGNIPAAQAAALVLGGKALILFE